MKDYFLATKVEVEVVEREGDRKGSNGQPALRQNETRMVWGLSLDRIGRDTVSVYDSIVYRMKWGAYGLG